MAFNLLLYMFIMIMFFYLKFKQNLYLYGGVIMVLTWICIFLNIRKELAKAFHLDSNLKPRKLQVISCETMKDLAERKFKSLSANGQLSSEFTEEIERIVKYNEK